MGILSTYRFSKIFVRHCVYFGFKAILVVEAIAAITIFYTKATAEGLAHFFLAYYCYKCLELYVRMYNEFARTSVVGSSVDRLILEREREFSLKSKSNKSGNT